MSNFFPMPASDRWYLVIVIVFAALAFLPWSRNLHVAGMAVFGWLMAGLMLLSPLIALLLIWRERRKG
ncbi:MAG: hypothetical protein ONB48_01620 [candidate division KSB1 bacterium]|nr:hypothetical protein [candidate division KSB1 bacterium]MDZ7272623.1 hypothetical protein [candidate division KSB1 bacterium]MDZ7284354.1 hypothetical protein [candidate division KSB1 bacterium]MDZ7297250.1 hypothetical protein [candidate division KSB1 bacterium]MDZ7348117.1 hypothetical protein [candidate division KSB1 bacterium]